MSVSIPAISKVQKTINQINNQIQPIQSMPLQHLPSESVCPRPFVEAQILTTSESLSSTHQENSIIDDENSFNQITLCEEQPISEKSEIKWPRKHKIDKKKQKMSRNARMKRFVSPKSPLMVFSELFEGVPPIQLQICPYGYYTAILKINGHVYIGKHFTKSQAKQNACESFFRTMLADKIRSSFEKKKEHSMDIDMKDSDNGTVPKPKRPLEEEFPWLHFASLAMHKLINHWELQSISKSNPLQEELNGCQLPLMIGGMKKFPVNPRIYNPVQLLNNMKPYVQFVTTTIHFETPKTYQVECNIDNIPFLGLGSSIKKAKKECCIAAIKYFWKFDFYAV